MMKHQGNYFKNRYIYFIFRMSKLKQHLFGKVIDSSRFPQENTSNELVRIERLENNKVLFSYLKNPFQIIN